MLEKFMEASIGMYVIWGIGLLGVLLKIMAGTYLKGMLKASENMATTKRRSLRIMRQKYENGKSLGINNGNSEAYVEKSVRSLRFIGLPLEFWRRSGQAMCCVVFMAMAGAFMYYDVSWRGSPDMVTYLANGVMVCAFLLGLENIFLINNKVEILKANIRGYLENIASPRDLPARAPARGRNRGRGDEGTGSGKPDIKKEGQSGSLESAAADMTVVPNASENADVSETESAVKPRAENEEVLNCFLKEFFS